MKTATYRYYCLYRPPMPGAIPRKGLVDIHEYDTKQNLGTFPAWGYADYDRKLSDDEVRNYELKEE